MKTLPIKTFNEYRCKEIPRFLYTITTKENFASMRNDGFIKTAIDPLRPKMKGIFLFDITNFTKRWTQNWFMRRVDLATELLATIATKSSDLVVLKIPTKNLNNDLYIRSLEYLFKNCDRYFYDKHLDIGLSAKYRKRLSQHKQSIEYIYKDNIPINQVEQIGKINIQNTLELSMGKYKIKDLLSKLFVGTPEHKAIEQMK